MNLPQAQQESKPKAQSYAEEQAMNEKIAQLKDAVDGVEVAGMQGVNFQARDKKGLEAKLKHLEKLQDETKIERAVGEERVLLEREEKDLRGELRAGMSWEEFSSVKKKDGLKFDRLVRKIRGWDADVERHKKVNRWKEIRRRLDPSDPDAASTLHFFD